MSKSLAEGCSGFRALGRREFLRVGGLSALGLTVPGFLKARASDYAGERPPVRAKACILLFLAGGPSQYETFDPKPEAPSTVRNIFETIHSSVPGTVMSEYLPDVARQAHRVALIRSAWHSFGGHFGGHRYALSGFPALGNADSPARADDKPGLIGHAHKHLTSRDNPFPSAVMLPWITTDQGSGASGGMGGGTLGRHYDPVRVEADMASLERGMPVFRIPEFALQPGMTSGRLDDRRALLDVVESQRRDMLSDSQRELGDHYQSAYNLLTSDQIKQGFDLQGEDHRLRERYGANAFGQSCLLARRLVERGSKFIQVNFCRYVTQRAYGWDTHDRGAETLSTHLIPKLNAGLGALLDDLADRGMLDETLVVAMGEFGRTPNVKRDGGRDHWPNCYSLLLAGGGIRGGIVYGRSDRTGARPADDPVEARQILMTILTLLGVPTFQTDQQGRAAPLFEGVEPVRRLYE